TRLTSGSTGDAGSSRSLPHVVGRPLRRNWVPGATVSKDGAREAPGRCGTGWARPVAPRDPQIGCGRRTPGGPRSPMRDIRIAVAEFEHHDGDKAATLAAVRALTRRAAGEGAEVVAFHECCLSGYTYLQHLDRDAFAAVAEPVPEGPTVRALVEIARE